MTLDEVRGRLGSSRTEGDEVVFEDSSEAVVRTGTPGSGDSTLVQTNTSYMVRVLAVNGRVVRISVWQVTTT
jgi:hypothetical protein